VRAYVRVGKMPHPPREPTRSSGTVGVVTLAALVGIAVVAISLRAAPGAARVRIVPRFTAGQTLRYRIETRTSTAGKATSPIVDPEAATKFTETATLIVRLEVLDLKPNPDGSTSRVRLRATYEKSDAVLESDAYDPGAAALQDQYEKLQGRVFQFTIEPDGKVTNVSGIDDLLANPATAGAVQSWMDGVTSPAKFPAQGIAIGQKWNGERPLANTPLAGLTFRTESTYERDDRCPSSAVSETATAGASDGSAASPATAVPEGNVPVCAVVLTRFRISRHGDEDDDATPQSYARNGLRTAGTWTGTGECLDDISLATGMTVRSTQTGHQDMNFEIASATSGSKMQYKGHIDSQSEVILLPNAAEPVSSPTTK
jgi:hypothetical protein